MSKSKAKGTQFEGALVPLVERYWPGTIRRPTEAALDKGDLYMPGNSLYVVEAKNASRLALPEWIAEAHKEAANAAVPFGVVVHKRRGKTAPEEQWATMTFGQWLALVHAHEARG